MKTLVMWSGGIDSTYTLAMMLKETDDEIVAHHIELVNREYRHISERHAVKKLLPKLQYIRPFKYEETLVDHTRLRLPAGGYDMANVCFAAGISMKDHMGTGRPIERFMIGSHKAEGHNWQRWQWIEPIAKGAFYSKDGNIDGYAPFYLHDLVSKADEMKYLNDLGLLEDTWYCRTPVNGMVCGSCKTCAEVRRAFLDNLERENHG